MRILIAEDDPVSRRVLTAALQTLGHEVTSASNGTQAWEALNADSFSLVISDWMMAEMDGVELCRKIRAHQNGGYVYFILLTAKGELEDLVEGMEAGADDFIVKPVDHRELAVRVRAGERILDLEQRLLDRSRELQKANERMQTDLQAAAEFQLSLLPVEPPHAPGYCFAWEFKPCAFVAGDILNVTQLDEKHWAFYVLDVSGHGVPSALLSVAISRILSPIDGQNSIVRRYTPETHSYEAVCPADVVQSLRERFPRGELPNTYFTLTYVLLHTESGALTWVRAGHTPPLLLRSNASPAFIQEGGTAIGLFPNGIVADEMVHTTLYPGDRFYLYSDGITEARNRPGKFFMEQRLSETLWANRRAPLDEATRKVVQAAADWTGARGFQDDVTILAVERLPLERPVPPPRDLLRACRVRSSVSAAITSIP